MIVIMIMMIMLLTQNGYGYVDRNAKTNWTALKTAVVCLTVIDSRNVCDRRKASSNGHHDRQYLDVTTTFTNFNSKIIFTIGRLSKPDLRQECYAGDSKYSGRQ